MNDLADPEKPIHPATKWFLGIIMVLAFLIATAVKHGGVWAILAGAVLFLIALLAFGLYEVFTFKRDAIRHP